MESKLQRTPSSKAGRTLARQSSSTSKAGVEEQTPSAEEIQFILLRERVKQQEEHIAALNTQHHQDTVELEKLKQQKALLEREQHAAATALQIQAQAADSKAESVAAEAKALNQKLAEQHAIATQREQTIIKELEHLTSSFSDEIVGLKSQLQSLEDFQMRKADMERDLAALKQQLIDMGVLHDKELAELHLRAYKAEEECKKVKDEALAREKAAGLDEKGEASDIVKLLQFNRRLVAKLKQAEKDIEAQRQQTEKAQAHCKAIQLELDTSRKLQADAIERCAQHSKVVSSIRAGAAQLELKISQLEASRADSTTCQESLQTSLIEAKDVIQKLQLQLRRAGKAHQALLHHNQSLLAERNEVQAYLVSSIRMVKNQIKLSNSSSQPLNPLQCARQQVQRPLSAAVGNIPTSPSPSPGAAPGSRTSSPISQTSRDSPSPTTPHFAATLRQSITSSGGRVDVSQLTWPEREQILRLLLAHVNASGQSGSGTAGTGTLEDSFKSNSPGSLCLYVEGPYDVGDDFGLNRNEEEKENSNVLDQQAGVRTDGQLHV